MADEVPSLKTIDLEQVDPKIRFAVQRSWKEPKVTIDGDTRVIDFGDAMTESLRESVGQRIK